MNKKKFEDKITELKATEKQNVNHGEIIVIRAYMNTTGYTDSETLVLDRGLFKHEMKEVLQALNDYEVNEFILSDNSTAVMSNILDFIEAGYEVKGKKDYNRTGIMVGTSKSGLLLVKNS